MVIDDGRINHETVPSGHKFNLKGQFSFWVSFIIYFRLWRLRSDLVWGFLQ